MTENADSAAADDGLPPLPDPGGSAGGSDGHESSMAHEPAIVGPTTGSTEKKDQVNIVPDIADSDPKIKAPDTGNQGNKQRDEFLGRTFGGYELVECIGHGGMGTVYKGRQVSLDRTVAVKLLLPALVDNEEFIKRFEREAKSIARLSHPNIVAVLDFGVSEDGVYFMVIEYVEGTSLASMIAEKLMLSFEEYLPVVSQCLAGLDHVSRHGVIHRDIKPDNILVDASGVSKLADFGLAKDVSEDSNQTDLTVAGSAMGTPAYMSPEQCMGRPLDVRSDIYAFGVTSYLALTGEKPFKGNSGFEVMTKQREYTPPAPHELNPQIHKKVSALIMRMLEKKPPDRFKDAAECREAWLLLGEELGFIVPSKMRSGEWDAHEMGADGAAIPVPVDDNLSAIPVNVPQPVQVDMGLQPPAGNTDAGVEDPFVQADQNSALPPPAPGSPSDRHPAKTSQSVTRQGTAATGPGSSPPPPPMPSSAPPAAPPPAPPNTQPGTDSPGFKRSNSDTFDSAEMRTCSQCGSQTKMQYTRCQNCGFDFSNEQTGSVDEQMRKADKALEQGRFKDAMAVYGRLADQTDDRKLRSVIRSKERGARKRYEDQMYERINKQSEELLNQGNIKGSIELLHREMENAKSSSELSSRLESQVSALRIKLKKKKRLGRFVLFLLLILIGGAVAAVYYRDQVPFLKALLDPYFEQSSEAVPGAGSDDADAGSEAAAGETADDGTGGGAGE